MDRTADRRAEKLSVGLYALVAALSASAFLGVQLAGGEPITGAFLVVGVVWLCVVVAVATALTVLVANVRRFVGSAQPDWTASGAAIAVLVAIGGALSVAVVAGAHHAMTALGAIGLVVAPLVLLLSVFDVGKNAPTAGR